MLLRLDRWPHRDARRRRRPGRRLGAGGSRGSRGAVEKPLTKDADELAEFEKWAAGDEGAFDPNQFKDAPPTNDEDYSDDDEFYEEEEDARRRVGPARKGADPTAPATRRGARTSSTAPRRGRGRGRGLPGGGGHRRAAEPPTRATARRRRRALGAQ